MKTVAVLGLGRMGEGIALRFIECRYKITVWNRSRWKAERLIKKGAIWANNPAEAAARAPIVLSMVADDVASMDVWAGVGGAFNTMQPGAVVVECSTLSLAHVTKLAALAKQKRLVYIDCPVTGLPEAAATGKLTLLVGADTADLEQARPVLECISNIIRLFGPVGTGTCYKLIINLMGAVQIAALAEGIALAGKFGIDKEAVITAIEKSAAASPQVKRHTRKMAELNFSPNPLFTTALRYKDAAYALELAESVGSAVLLGQVATDWFKAAANENPNQDEAAVINAISSFTV